MERLVKDAEFAKIIEEAARTMRERFSPHEIGKIYEKRMKSHTLW